MAEAEYSIAGGRVDADRLARQAGVMATASTSFLRRVGAQPGMACLDVGCGDGQISIQLARLVGPTGRVVGVDSDGDAIAIARRAAGAAGVDVTFVEGDAATPLERGGFDLAFARLLLSHLVDPMAVVRAMRLAVRPGGFVAVEDLYTPSLHAEPPVPALDRLAAIYSATVRARGGDPTIGPRLQAHLTAAQLVDVEEHTVVNPMADASQKLFLAELLDNMRTSIIETGSATPDELADVRAEVTAAANRTDTTFFQARMHQVSGRRP
jgi:ubiquinone/menaquinone biosynthesis C-methylase UbiE